MTVQRGRLFRQMHDVWNAVPIEDVRFEQQIQSERKRSMMIMCGDVVGNRYGCVYNKSRGQDRLEVETTLIKG